MNNPGQVTVRTRIISFYGEGEQKDVGEEHGTCSPGLQERGKDSPGEEQSLPGQGERSAYSNE